MTQVIRPALPEAPLELQRRPRRLHVMLAFGVLCLVWGSTYLAIRFAVETLPPFLLMGTRSLVAGGLLYGWVRARGGPSMRAGDWREAFLQGGLLFVGCHGALAWGQARVPSGQAALLFATMPAWMALGEWLGPERVRPGRLAFPGLLLGVAGVAALMHPADLLGPGATGWAGAAALLFAVLSWVIGSLRARHVPLPGGALQRAGANLMAGGLMLFAAAWVRGERVVGAEVSARSLLALLYLIGFGTMLALTSYLWLLQRERPTLVASYAFVSPVVAVALGTLLGGERLDARIWVATLLMVASVAILLRDRESRDGRRVPG